LALLDWAKEAGIGLHFRKDVGSELLYACDGRWKQFHASVDKAGRIFVSWGLTENSIVHDKRHFMQLVQRQRDFLAKNP
jgi:hypothetical protein